MIVIWIEKAVGVWVSVFEKKTKKDVVASLPKKSELVKNLC